MRRMLLPLLLLAACGHAERLPEGVMDRERFTQAIVGMTLLEARMSMEASAGPPAPPPMDRYYADFFRENGLDSASFRRSFDYYAMRPGEMESIYEDAVERLRRMKDERPQAPAMNETVLDTASSSDLNR